MNLYGTPSALVDYSADSMFREIISAEKSREAALCHYDNLLANAMATEEWPEPLTYQFLSFMIPRIVQENPTVSVKSRIEGSQLVTSEVEQMIQQGVQAGVMDPAEGQMLLESMRRPHQNASAGSHALKRWIHQENYREILDILVDDYLKSWAVGLTWMAPMKNKKGLYWPRTCRLQPRRFLMDPLAKHKRETAWEGHWYEVPKPKMVQMAKDDEEAGWDHAAISNISTASNDRHNVDRKEIRVYETWIRDYDGEGADNTGDQSMNGAWLTFGCPAHSKEEIGVQIRKPRPAYVPPWGPYSMFACYNRSETGWPMSPLLATFKQQEEIQAHARAMNANARQYRRILLVSDKNPQLAAKLKNSPDQLIITVSDEQFDKDQVVSIEVGGISDQQLKIYAHVKTTLENSMGMDDSQRGRVDSSATATAVAVADESVATRVSYIESKFIAGVRQNLRNILWYMVMDERFQIRLGSEASEEFGMIQPWFEGGLTNDEEGEGFDFNDLELVIDPYSMGRVSEQALQRRVTEFINMLVTLAPAMLQFQFIDWKSVIRSMTQVLNLPELDGAIDHNALQQMAMMQQMQAESQMMSGDGAVRSSSGPEKERSNAGQMVDARARGVA